jgi:hypothetical protein
MRCPVACTIVVKEFHQHFPVRSFPVLIHVSNGSPPSYCQDVDLVEAISNASFTTNDAILVSNPIDVRKREKVSNPIDVRKRARGQRMPFFEHD